ncbi:MAG: hypothetical protein EOP06_25050, partial [Proteobacteria bacterium]
DFDIKDVHATKAVVASVSGEISFKEVGIDHAEANTVSGDIDYAGKIARLELRSMSGSVQVTSQELSASRIDLKTVSGEIINPFHSFTQSKSHIEIATVSGDIEVGTND